MNTECTYNDGTLTGECCDCEECMKHFDPLPNDAPKANGMIQIRSERFRTAFFAAAKKANINLDGVVVFDFTDMEAWGNRSGYAVFAEDKELEQRVCDFIYNWHRKQDYRNVYPASEIRYDEKPEHEFKDREKTPTYSVRKVKISYYSIGD